LVLHEVWGFNDFVEQFCKRLAAEGFSVSAPLLYSHMEAPFAEPNLREAMRVVWDLPLEKRYVKADLESTISAAGAREEVAAVLRELYDRRRRRRMLRGVQDIVSRLTDIDGDGLAAIGLSMGGGIAYSLASKEARRIRACATYSAEPPRERTLQKISSPLLAFYGAEDKFMTQRLPRFVREVLSVGRLDCSLVIYQRAGHEFFDWTNARGYDQNGALRSWRALVSFLNENLREEGLPTV
jgi:dienelactone hydrolase